MTNRRIIELTSEQIGVARKMVRAGADIGAIHAALGLEMKPNSLRDALRRLGIHIIHRRFAHHGHLPSAGAAS